MADSKWLELSDKWFIRGNVGVRRRYGAWHCYRRIDDEWGVAVDRMTGFEEFSFARDAAERLPPKCAGKGRVFWRKVGAIWSWGFMGPDNQQWGIGGINGPRELPICVHLGGGPLAAMAKVRHSGLYWHEEPTSWDGDLTFDHPPPHYRSFNPSIRCTHPDCGGTVH